MKYRVKIGSSDIHPFIIQRKNEKAFLSFWRTVERAKTEYDVKRFMQISVARHAKFKIGAVIATYDEMDLIADTLKDKAAVSAEYYIPQAAMESANVKPGTIARGITKI